MDKEVVLLGIACSDEVEYVDKTILQWSPVLKKKHAANKV